MIDLPCVQLTPTGARAEYSDVVKAWDAARFLAAFGLTVTLRTRNCCDDPFVSHYSYLVEVTR